MSDKSSPLLPFLIVAALVALGVWGYRSWSGRSPEAPGPAAASKPVVRAAPAARAAPAPARPAGPGEPADKSASDDGGGGFFTGSGRPARAIAREEAPEPAGLPDRPVAPKAEPKPRPAPASRPERTPEQKARSFVELARNYLSAERPDKAIEFLNRVLAEYPNTPAALEARELLDKLQPKPGE